MENTQKSHMFNLILPEQFVTTSVTAPVEEAITQVIDTDYLQASSTFAATYFLYGFAFSTLLVLLTYGAHKAFSLIRIKN